MAGKPSLPRDGVASPRNKTSMCPSLTHALRKITHALAEIRQIVSVTPILKIQFNNWVGFILKPPGSH